MFDPFFRVTYSLELLVQLDFPGGPYGKESACNEGDLGSIPGLRRSPGGEHGEPGILAWRISATEEPAKLQFTGLQRVKHD